MKIKREPTLILDLFIYFHRLKKCIKGVVVSDSIHPSGAKRS